MKQKLKIIIIIMLLIIASLQIMTFPESNTLADPVEGGGDDGYLDFEYYFNTVSNLSGIIHDETVYGPGEMKKGRYFGSNGDKASADYLYNDFMDACGFSESDVRKVQLGDVQGASYEHHYTEFVEVTECGLTINHPNFIHNTRLPSATIPRDDFYPIVAVRDPLNDYTKNTYFDDNRVWNEWEFFNSFPK